MCGKRTDGRVLVLPTVVVFLGSLLPTSAQPRMSGETILREAEEALQAEDLVTAERLYRAAAVADPGSAEASCGLGQVLLALRRYEEAVTSLEDCRRRILTSLRALRSRQARAWSEIEQERRRVEEALQAVRSGRRRSAGRDAELRLEERLRELQQARGQEPVRVEVPPRIAFALGTAYLSVGLPEKAEGELLALLETDPGSGEVHNNLAAVYLSLGRFEEAAEHLRLAEEAGVEVSPQMKADIESRYAPAVVSPGRASPTRERKEESLRVEHVARTCALRGRFPRFRVKVTPSWGIHDPVLRFRTDADTGWYSVFMLPAGQDVFAASLPRPREAERFTYSIDVTSYDDQVTSTPDYTVAVVAELITCEEAGADPRDAEAILIVDPPEDAADAQRVPRGFSIRGTTADAGAIEVGPNKALLYGGIGLAGGVAAGLVAATSGGGAYEGPEPFSEAPGISLVALDPPSGSTLSLSEGHLAVQLAIYSVEALPGAQIVAEASNYWGPCLRRSTTQDLPAHQTVTVVLNGFSAPMGETCRSEYPLDQLHVSVSRADGSPAFQTGIPPLAHIPISFELVD